jgi:hypothetical protein
LLDSLWDIDGGEVRARHCLINMTLEGWDWLFAGDCFGHRGFVPRRPCSAHHINTQLRNNQRRPQHPDIATLFTDVFNPLGKERIRAVFAPSPQLSVNSNFVGGVEEARHDAQGASIACQLAGNTQCHASLRFQGRNYPWRWYGCGHHRRPRSAPTARTLSRCCVMVRAMLVLHARALRL